MMVTIRMTIRIRIRIIGKGEKGTKGTKGNVEMKFVWVSGVNRDL